MIPTTSAPAFSPGSYGTLKLLGRFEFCRFSSFCLSCEITVIVRSTQKLHEFKRSLTLSLAFPEATSMHNILYIWSGVEQEQTVEVSVFEELTIRRREVSWVYREQDGHGHDSTAEDRSM